MRNSTEWVWEYSPYRASGFILHLALARIDDKCGRIEVSQNELAKMTGMTREHVNRTMGQLKADGFITAMPPSTYTLVYPDAQEKRTQ